MQANVTDTRDTRGKRHDLHFVLCGVLLAILSGKVLVTEIHRWLVRNHTFLNYILDFEAVKPVSDGQLRRLLANIDPYQLHQFHCRYFGWSVPLVASGGWVSIDGKELRGTIEGVLGEKRGLCLVHLVSHQGVSIASDFYEGQKESEIIVARNLLTCSNLSNSGVTLDALHCQIETLEMVVNQAGVYVVEVKANQAELAADLVDHMSFCKPTNTIQTYDKGHGRIEKRTYSFYDVSGICFNSRWQVADIQRLIVVDRHFTQIKTGKVSQEESFYITNSIKHEDAVLAGAIRGHWRIESGHWVRDVTYGEDAIRCSNRQRMKTLSLLLSAALTLTCQQGLPNIKAFHEDANAKPMIISALIVHHETP